MPVIIHQSNYCVEIELKDKATAPLCVCVCVRERERDRERERERERERGKEFAWLFFPLFIYFHLLILSFFLSKGASNYANIYLLLEKCMNAHASV